MKKIEITLLAVLAVSLFSCVGWICNLLGC